MLIPIQAPEDASSAATVTTTTHDSPFNERRQDDEINMQILPMCTQGSLKRNCNHNNSNTKRSQQTLDRRSSSCQEYSPANSIIDYSFASLETTTRPLSNNTDRGNRSHCKDNCDNNESRKRSRNNPSPSSSLASFSSSRNDSITRLQQQQQSDSSRSSLASNDDGDINCNLLRETNNKCRHHSNTSSLDDGSNPPSPSPRSLLEQKHHTVSLDSGCSSDPSEEKDRLLQANNTKSTSNKYSPLKHHDRRLLLCQRNNNTDVESAISPTTDGDCKLKTPWEPLLRASLSSNCESMIDDGALRSL